MEWVALANNESPHLVTLKQEVNNTWPGISWRNSNSRKMTKVDHDVFYYCQKFSISAKAEEIVQYTAVYLLFKPSHISFINTFLIFAFSAEVFKGRPQTSGNFIPPDFNLCL